MHAFWLNNKLTHIISHPKQSYFILKEIYDFFVPIFKSTRYTENRFTRYIYTNAHTHRIPKKIFSQKATERLLRNLCSRAPTTMLKTTFSSFGFFFRFRKKNQHFCLQISTKMMRLECLASLSCHGAVCMLPLADCVIALG